MGDWFQSKVHDSVCDAGGGRGSVEALYTTALDFEQALSGIVDSDIRIFDADVTKAFDTVDRVFLDKVLSDLGLPACFKHAYFEYHSHVPAGMGRPWPREDGGIPQEWPLSVVFIVALYLPWCKYQGAQVGVQLQLNAYNLMCVSWDRGALLRAAGFTTWCVRLVGQEQAPNLCVFLITSRAVRSYMRGWIVTDAGDRLSV